MQNDAKSASTPIFLKAGVAAVGFLAASAFAAAAGSAAWHNKHHTCRVSYRSRTAAMSCVKHARIAYPEGCFLLSRPAA